MLYTRIVTAPIVDRSSQRFGAYYLALLLVGPVVYDLVLRVFHDAGAFGVLPWSLVALYGSAIAAAVCWVRFSANARWSPWMRAWLVLGVLVWLFVMASAGLHGEEVVGAAAFVPVTFLLILIKRPSRQDCWRAADAFAWVTVVAIAVLLILEVGNVISPWYADHGRVGVDLLQFDRANYWLPLTGPLGLEGRWGGLPGYPNIAGQMGALLVVYGLSRPARRRWVFVLAGLITLLLTDSRTSYAAAAVGLLLLTVLPGWGATYWKITPARVVALVLALAMGLRVLIQVVMDPSLTGRLAMWREFFSLVRGFLPFGTGQDVIDSAIADGSLPAWAHQGHNLFLDTFVRYGLVGLVITVLFVGLAVVLTFRPIGREVGVGLALIAALIVSCLGDLGIGWTYPSEGLSFLLVAVLVSQVERGTYALAAASSSVATSTTSTPSATPSD